MQAGVGADPATYRSEDRDAGAELSGGSSNDVAASAERTGSGAAAAQAGQADAAQPDVSPAGDSGSPNGTAEGRQDDSTAVSGPSHVQAGPAPPADNSARPGAAAIAAPQRHDSTGAAGSLAAPAADVAESAEEEPRLKYQRLGCDLTTLLATAEATCLAISDKVLGAHAEYKCLMLSEIADARQGCKRVLRCSLASGAIAALPLRMI